MFKLNGKCVAASNRVAAGKPPVGRLSPTNK